ncbi:MAG TPA: glycoside hydrolase family 38 C-terminal domain-containing protein [Halanaerobiales bacterium]|nr:glycoside hydrolase family 38 C-terminal domain-containing protein [Halanaerobiales bacterium]
MLPDKIDLKLRDLKKEMFENKYAIKKWNKQEVKRVSESEYEPIEGQKEFLTGDQSYWDNTGKIFFFQREVKLPQKLEKENLYLHLDISGECTLFINGEVYRGINEKNIKLPKTDSNTYHFKILATHDVHLSVRHQRLFNIPYPPHIFRNSFLFNKNKDIEKLYVLLKNIKKTIDVLESKREQLILQNLLEDTLNQIDFFTNKRKEFLTSINKSYQSIVNELQNIENSNVGKVFLLAHSHLDLAFKWTITDSIRKLERTISTTVNLMDSYDNYYFIQSQSILYEYLKEYYPNLFQKVKEKYRENKFIVEGAFYVESDLNLPHGESLIRQILYGKKFYQDKFDNNTNLAWLPDCFGFSAILPQILKKSEINFFLTTKLQWNETNQFPYNLFKWEGIDGSQISSYLLSDEYGGNLEPKKIYKAWENRKQKDLDEVLSLYGFGDGGGGNNEVQLNNYEALEKIPFLPKIETSDIHNHLNTIFNKNELPTWKDELYLEKHRGTYTSQAELKKYNRKLEFKLRNMELLYSSAKLNGYEKEYNLEKLWKILLKNQFHDILPGSCVHDVYEDAVEDYERLDTGLEDIKNELFAFFSNKYRLDHNQFIIFNPLSFERNDLIEIKKEELEKEYDKEYDSVTINNNKYPVQKSNNSYYFKPNHLSPLSFTKLTFSNNKNIKYENHLNSSQYSIENKYIKVTLDKKGQISSIFDKEKEIEYIQANQKANQLKLYDDKSTYFDTWDISISEQNKRIIDNIKDIKVKAAGPYFHSIEIKRGFYNSSIRQEMILYENKRKIDFKTEVNWQESQKLLKTAFPIKIKNSQALFDLSMGHIERANYKNTSWERAKKEVPAHKWVNLNNKDISVSLLNDCKYGHEINENVINLTLLKSGIFPDPKADIGKHEFTYSLLLNPDSLDLVNLEREALAMNNKPIYCNINNNNEEDNKVKKLFDIKNDHILLDSYKISENKDGFILRVHEFKGISNQLEIKFLNKIKEVYETNLLEKNVEEISIENNNLTVKINPFEIKTFRIKF